MHRTTGAAPRRGRGRSLALPAVWGALTVGYELGCPLAAEDALGARLATSAVLLAVGSGLMLRLRRVLLREVRQVRRVAGAAQNALLGPLPPQVAGLALAARRLSADGHAALGGDLYEVASTEHGVRVVIGDVRGHGLAALGTAAALLGGFREAAHDEPELAGVLRRLERTHARHQRLRAGRRPADRAWGGEDFVTVLLLQIAADGRMTALNCGHPWPYRLRGPAAGAPGAARRVEQLHADDPLPPLGSFPLPAELPPLSCGLLRPGEALFLHTDGASDARDAAGRFFPLRAALADTVRRAQPAPRAVVGAVHSRLLRHTGGAPEDDVALLVLRNDRRPLPAPGTGPMARPAAR
ncbi:PP2C family protein-serine/threonine phosphatase [Streptomyces sp. NPDC058045]|uniref:PP2C family protein-serine/threonine phosphatase n=1 Tax=Streptomyces sp. NPDC058045 TaxID=3346311 RepID=UPI0036EAE395